MTSNPWIEHVKNYAKLHNLKYGDAMKKAKQSYVAVGTRL